MIIYLTDGSLQNFYTAVFYAYNKKNCIITSNENVQLTFDSQLVKVTTEHDKVKRVINKLKEFDDLAEDEVSLVLRSYDDLKEQTAFEYIKLLVKTQKPIRGNLSHPTVLEMDDLRRKVTTEIHHFKGFLRFMETEQGILYAPFSPDNDVTDFLCAHFAERLKMQKFVIHDVKRKKAAMYDGNSWILQNVGEAEVYLSQYEKVFESLWKKYYNSVNIKERPHEKQMKGYMPVRYWKFMPEKKDV